MLSTSDVKPYVTAVLQANVNSLSAYQILDRLPTEIRQQIIDERGAPGIGAGHPFGSAKFVSIIAEQVVPNLEPPHRIYVDTKGMNFLVAGSPVMTGGAPIAFYRLLTQAEMP